MVVRIAGYSSSILFLLALVSTGHCQSPNSSIERWQNQLRHPAPTFRARAATELGRLGKQAQAAAPDLQDNLRDADANVRLTTTQALACIQSTGELGASEIASAKEILLLLDDSDEHVRYTAEWAMARFALQSTSLDHAAEYRALLQSAIATLEHRKHNTRHLRVISQALTDLDSLAPSPRAVVQTPATDLTPQLPIKPKTKQPSAGNSRLDSMVAQFKNSNRANKLAIIDWLTPMHSDRVSPDEQALRTSILRHAILEGEFASVHFALRRWQTAGQLSILSLFDSLDVESQLPNWATTVLFEVQPRQLVDIEKLAIIANNGENRDSVRSAAMQALTASSIYLDATFRCIARIHQSDLDDSMHAEAVKRLCDYTNTGAWPRLKPESQHQLAGKLETLAADKRMTWRVRSEAALGLARIGNTTVETFLIEALQDEGLPDYQLREILAIATSEEQPSMAAKSLIWRCLSSNDDLTRLEAIHAVKRLDLHEPEFTAQLHLLLADPYESSDNQAAALRTLVSFGQQEIDAVATLLSEIAEQDEHLDQACLVASVLSESRYLPASVERTFRQILEHPNREDQLKIAVAFACSKSENSSNELPTALKEILASDSSPAVRASALIALARQKQITADEISLVSFDEHDGVGQVALAVAMNTIGQPSGMHSLLNMLDSEHSTLAQLALADMGESAKLPLLELLENPNAPPEQRTSSLEVLTLLPYVDPRPLILSVADAEIGDACSDCIYRLLDNGPEVLGSLVSTMRELPQSPGRDRIEELVYAYTEGPGSGTGLDSQLASLGELGNAMLEHQFASEQAMHASAMSAPAFAPEHPTGTGMAIGMKDTSRITGAASPSPMPVSSSLAFDLPYPVEPVEMASMEIPAAAPSMPESASTAFEESLSESIDSLLNPIPLAEAGDIEIIEEETPTATPRDRARVKVFYGTNRAPESTAQKTSLPFVPSNLTGGSRSKVLAVLAAIATISVCFFGFLRQNARVYSVFSVAGLCLVAWLGLNNLEYRATPTPETIANSFQNVSYGGTYTNRLAMGVCEVSLPENHQEGELESESWIQLEFKKDPSKHVVLTKTRELTNDTFFDEMKLETDLRGDSLLVFIHGYNVSFEDAARRTAQLAFDLKYEGAPVFYSWPSSSNWYRYQLDKKNVQLSVNQIRNFLTQLAEQSGVETINLIAHSMGNVGLTSALAEIDATGDDALFNQVVLAAPDIDADIFESRIAPKIVDKAKQFTLYTSTGDLALVASRYFNSGRRLGESGDPVMHYPGIDVIDASGVDTSLLGHSYYGSSLSVIKDLGELLRDRPVHYRSYLKTAGTGGRNYWVLESPQLARRAEESSLNFR